MTNADKSFEVLIVGAGPAGAFAAERLARAGVSVALFDGRPAGEPKACGGGVTSKALRAWPHLLEATCRLVDEVEMYSPVGRRVLLKLAEPFAIYSRTAFDAFLLERACAAGAQVIRERVSVAVRDEEQQPWVVYGKQGTNRWQGRVLVAADGANSPLARRLAGALSNAEMEVAFGYRTPWPKETPEVPTVIAFLPQWAGYAWAFPRLDHISFGIATSQDKFDHPALDRLLWKFMIGYYRQRADKHAPLWSTSTNNRGRTASDQAMEEKLRATANRYAARIPGLTPQTLMTRRAAGHGWALLGDAAGFADPVTGEGIYYALRSAELFADTYVEKKSTITYDEHWRADFGRELLRAAQMRGRFYGPFWGAPFTDRMIDLARAHRGIRRTLCELVAGEQGYLDLKRMLVRRAVWPI